MGRIGGKGPKLSNLIDCHRNKGNSLAFDFEFMYTSCWLGISFVLVVAGEMDFKSTRKEALERFGEYM